MKLSLVLCTKNGGERLGKCLESIDALDVRDPFELILVDNGSDDGVSDRLLRDYAARTRFPCRVLTVTIPGNSAGRNVAIEHAEGDVLLFTDDDCYLEPTFVTEWGAVFRSSDVGYGSGMIRQFDDRFAFLGCNESTVELRIPPRRFVRRGVVQGSNMAFRAECVRRAGPFDVRFGAGTRLAGEEWEVALRASRQGFAGAYFPGPIVWHDHRRDEGEGWERALFYDYGAGAVYAKHLLSFAPGDAFKELYRDWRKLEVWERRKALLRGMYDYAAGRLNSR